MITPAVAAGSSPNFVGLATRSPVSKRVKESPGSRELVRGNAV
jgi:hypothetical protein